MHVALADAAGEALDDVLVHDIPVNRNFRNQDAVRLGGHAAAEGGVTGVAPEHLRDQHAVVGASGGLEILDELRDAVDGGVAADRVGLEVEVHRLRAVDALDAVVVQVDHDAARIVAAADDQRVEVELLHADLDAVVLVGVADRLDLDARMARFRTGEACLELVEAGFVEPDQALLVQEVVQSGVAVGDDIEFETLVQGHERGTLDDGVQAAAVAAAGKNSDFLHAAFSSSLGLVFNSLI